MVNSDNVIDLSKWTTNKVFKEISKAADIDTQPYDVYRSGVEGFVSITNLSFSKHRSRAERTIKELKRLLRYLWDDRCDVSYTGLQLQTALDMISGQLNNFMLYPKIMSPPKCY